MFDVTSTGFAYVAGLVNPSCMARWASYLLNANARMWVVCNLEVPIMRFQEKELLGLSSILCLGVERSGSYPGCFGGSLSIAG